MEIGAKIRSLREQNKLSQLELAKIAGVSEGTIIGYEANKDSMKLNVLSKLAEVLNVSLEHLMGHDLPAIPNALTLDATEYIPVSYYNGKVSAGRGIANFDNSNAPLIFSREYLRITFGIHNIKNLQMVDVDGSSMSPTLESGDCVLVSPNQNQIKDGAIYVVEYHGDVFIKRIQHNPKTGKVRLISDNKNFEPIEVEGDDLDNLRIIGQALVKNRTQYIG